MWRKVRSSFVCLSLPRSYAGSLKSAVSTREYKVSLQKSNSLQQYRDGATLRSIQPTRFCRARQGWTNTPHRLQEYERSVKENKRFQDYQTSEGLTMGVPHYEGKSRRAIATRKTTQRERCVVGNVAPRGEIWSTTTES